MKKKLNQKEQWYADTRAEAEEIVEDAKKDKHLTMHKITGKSNKFGPYFLTDLTYTYATPKEIMEDGDAVPEGQLSIDEVDEGHEYTTNGDGTVDVKLEETTDESEVSPF